MFDTYYTVLGISETATQKEIKAAYRELIKQVHPDSVPNASPYWKQAAEEKSKEVTEAYRVLSNTIQRAKYDQNLADLRKSAQAAPQPQPQPVSQPQPPSTPQSHTRYKSAVAINWLFKGVCGLLVGAFFYYAATQPVQPSAAQPTTTQPASGFDPSKPLTVVVPKTIAKPVAKVEKAPEPMTVAWARAHGLDKDVEAKEATCQFPAASVNGAGLTGVSDEVWDDYCANSPLLYWDDYTNAHPQPKPKHIITSFGVVEGPCCWLRVTNHYGINLLRRCAYNIGTSPCGPKDNIVAKLQQGDRLRLLEPVCKRTPDGTDACHVQAVNGGWTGYVGETGVELEEQ